MKIKKILFLFLLLKKIVPLSAAEEYIAEGSNQQADPMPPALCLVCNHKLAVAFTHSLNMTYVDTTTESPVKTYPRLLVLVNTGTQWQLALAAKHDPSAQKIAVHSCTDHSVSLQPIAHIRRLKPFWQYSWQPRIPIKAIHDNVKLYIEQYRRTDTKPYIQAKIIDQTQKIIAIGDLHGSSKSLRTILAQLCARHIMNHDYQLAPGYLLVFTGDYTDRGRHGGEVWQILIDLKRKNTAHVWLLKGNHETLFMAQRGEFLVEWLNINVDLNMAEQETLLKDLFNILPQALLLGVRPSVTGTDNPMSHFLLFCHGGIDKTVQLYEAMFQAIMADKTQGQNRLISYSFTHNNPEFTGLLWSDFFANRSDEDMPFETPSERGSCIKKYNGAAVHDFVKQHSNINPENPCSLDAIIRGHQHIPGGIARLEKVSYDDPDWTPLISDQSELIERGSVYTCTSSPGGLAPFGCFEDSYALIEWNDTQKQWQLTPHIERRVPKRYSGITL